MYFIGLDRVSPGVSWAIPTGLGLFWAIWIYDVRSPTGKKRQRRCNHTMNANPNPMTGNRIKVNSTNLRSRGINKIRRLALS